MVYLKLNGAFWAKKVEKIKKIENVEKF